MTGAPPGGGTTDYAVEIFYEAMKMINGLLPDPVHHDGDEARPGRENESDLAGPSSVLTTLTYSAAAKNNET